jgi:hypothetical protein
MNIMNMPGFTAEASLYKTNGHYRSDRNTHAINLPAQTMSTIHPTAMMVEGEVIEVSGEAPQAPWGLPSGWGPWGWGAPHGSGGPIPSGPSEGGGKGGGEKTPPKKQPPLNQRCTMKQLQSKAAAPCIERGVRDVLDHNLKNPHFVFCDGGGIMFCCQADLRQGGANCSQIAS